MVNTYLTRAPAMGCECGHTPSPAHPTRSLHESETMAFPQRAAQNRTLRGIKNPARRADHTGLNSQRSTLLASACATSRSTSSLNKKRAATARSVAFRTAAT